MHYGYVELNGECPARSRNGTIPDFGDGLALLIQSDDNNDVYGKHQQHYGVENPFHGSLTGSLDDSQQRDTNRDLTKTEAHDAEGLTEGVVL